MHRITRSLKLGVIVGSAVLLAACSVPVGGEQPRQPQQAPASSPGLVTAPAPIAGTVGTQVPGEWEGFRKRKRHQPARQRISRPQRRGFNVANLPARPVPLP